MTELFKSEVVNQIWYDLPRVFINIKHKHPKNNPIRTKNPALEAGFLWKILFRM